MGSLALASAPRLLGTDFGAHLFDSFRGRGRTVLGAINVATIAAVGREGLAAVRAQARFTDGRRAVKSALLAGLRTIFLPTSVRLKFSRTMRTDPSPVELRRCLASLVVGAPTASLGTIFLPAPDRSEIGHAESAGPGPLPEGIFFGRHSGRLAVRPMARKCIYTSHVAATLARETPDKN